MNPANPPQSPSFQEDPHAFMQANAMAHLRGREFYRSQGWARFKFPLFFLLDLAVYAGLGWISSLLGGWTREAVSGHGLMALIEPFFFLIVFVSGIMYLLSSFNRNQVHRLPLIILSCFALSYAFVAGRNFELLTDPYTSSFALFFFHVKAVFFSIIAILLTCNDAFRVHYAVDGGKWGERHVAYFKPRSAKDVLAALEQGQFHLLNKLRTEGPNPQGHGYQSFTVLTVSTCPGHPGQPVYLHLKDVSMGGGALYTSRIHATMGKSWLPHVRLQEHDLRCLANLLPGLFVNWSDAPAELHQNQDNKILKTGQAIGAKNEHTPLGLPVGGPLSAESPQGSFIRALPPSDHRRLRWRFYPFMFSMVFSFAICLLSFSSLIRANQGRGQSADPLVATICFSIAAAAIMVGMFYLKIARRLVKNAIATRPSRLFLPDDADELYVLEESRTFEITKLIAEDVALVRVRPGLLQLELSRAQVHLLTRDLLALDIHKSSNNCIGLRISARFGDLPWEITLSPLKNSLFDKRKPLLRVTEAGKRMTEILRQQPTEPASARPLNQPASLSGHQK